MESERRLEELRKAFVESKLGVKGLVDSGITKVPSIFIRPAHQLDSDAADSGVFSLPVIDLAAAASRSDLVDEIRRASETTGCFYVVNHGVPTRVMDEVLRATRGFHELPSEVKKEFYSHEISHTVMFQSNPISFHSCFASWRDTLVFAVGHDNLLPRDLPLICRDAMVEYSEHVGRLGSSLLELLSEALGLNADHLMGMGCAEKYRLLYNYYPSCPEPELTMGLNAHTDIGFLTILLQDRVGLQFFHQNKVANVETIPEALVVNLGDLLQIMSNDRYKTARHRVLANKYNSRTFVACIFGTQIRLNSDVCEPIKELVSEENPSVYKQIQIQEYIKCYGLNGFDGTTALPLFKLST